jgi:large conductance mechanosensitive channel
MKDFKEFLKEYKIISLAVAFITSLAVNDLVQSLVNDVIMPIITPFVPAGGWEQATLIIGPIVLNWGSFLSSLIYFTIIMLVVFLFIKSLKKFEKKKKKK